LHGYTFKKSLIHFLIPRPPLTITTGYRKETYFLTSDHHNITFRPHLPLQWTSSLNDNIYNSRQELSPSPPSEVLLEEPPKSPISRELHNHPPREKSVGGSVMSPNSAIEVHEPFSPRSIPDYHNSLRDPSVNASPRSRSRPRLRSLFRMGDGDVVFFE